MLNTIREQKQQLDAAASAQSSTDAGLATVTAELERARAAYAARDEVARGLQTEGASVRATDANGRGPVLVLHASLRYAAYMPLVGPPTPPIPAIRYPCPPRVLHCNFRLAGPTGSVTLSLMDELAHFLPR